MNTVKTRNQSTYLYQDLDPFENQIIWVKSESRNWEKSKITKILDKKSVSGGEEFIVEMKEFPGKVITITKYLASQQDPYKIPMDGLDILLRMNKRLWIYGKRTSMKLIMRTDMTSIFTKVFLKKILNLQLKVRTEELKRVS